MKHFRGGFTVVETMIFLAVSGVMFVGAAAIFGGQQQETQFNQSVRQFEASLNDIINDTSTGVFPQVNDIRCSYTGASISFIQDTGARPGANNDCLFLGKAVQLGVGNYANGPDEDYIVHTVVGRNNVSSSSFSDSYPSALQNDSAPSFDSAEDEMIPWGTGIERSFYFDSTGTPIYVTGFAVFYSRFGQVDVGQNFASGATNLSLYALQAPSPQNENITFSRQGESAFRFRLSDIPAIVDPGSPIFVCLEGPGGRSAAIEVGSDNGALIARANFEPPAECTV